MVKRTETPPWGLHWFRRDLRLAGNPALRSNWARHRRRVVGFFCFDPKFLERPDFSNDRFGFFLETLRALKNELLEGGGDLLVMADSPEVALDRLFTKLDQSGVAHPQTVSFNRDYEPFARARDLKVKRLLASRTKADVITERDHLLIEPEEITPPSHPTKQYYTVYSPFSRKWLEKLATPEVKARIEAQKEGLDYLAARDQDKAIPPLFALNWKKLFTPLAPPEDRLLEFISRCAPKLGVPLPPAGSLEAFRRLKRFQPSLPNYKEDRDRLDLPGTSRLSHYIKNGSLTSSQILAYLRIEPESVGEKTGSAHFLKEIAWREFYYHILWHRPDVESQAFLPGLRKLNWENDEGKFSAWKEGRTGYPVVDAAMRELATTGLMHNRARMIVASFLTKDLLIDWQWGERYFMERLLDGDLAPNNGGWQWAASTGCDPQPYFRIFNPELQSRKFDPSGQYIRAFVPELKHLSDQEIHAPPPLSLSRMDLGQYFPPIVDHAEQRLKALKIYKNQLT